MSDVDLGSTQATEPAAREVSPALATTIASTARESAPRTEVGRYRLGRRIGAGGMGVVWEAVDPELDRRVAVKLVRGGTGSAGSFGEQLRGEAQALARLSDPHVVQVYDVGVADGELYIVMQLVDGATLDRYLAARQRSLREIVQLFVQAGRGLASAHSAGIIHRDFKPANALVEHDGTVRVSDFGLAWRSKPATPDGAPALAESSGLAGTPAYMAPEQFGGGEITPATDQFAFCVALWEAIYGERPFEGGDLETLRTAVCNGHRREPPPHTRVPRRIRRVLERGLAVAPAERFGSMQALLAALAPPRRLGLVIGGGAVIVAGAAALAATSLSSRPDPCADVDQPAAAVWNAARQQAVRGALGDAAPPVIAKLDDRIARWRAGRRDACMATAVRGEQPASVRDTRYACLERSLVDVRTAADVLAGSVDPLTRARALDVATSGTDPDSCGAAGAKAFAPIARDPAHDAVYAQIARATALLDAGRFTEVDQHAAELSATIDATHDDELAARWYYQLGRDAGQLAQTARELDAYRRSAQAASAVGLDGVAAAAWAQLAIASAQSGELHAADDLVIVADGAAKRAGTPRARLVVDDAKAQIALERGQLDVAQKLATQVVDEQEHLDASDGLAVSDYLGELADVQLQAEDYAGARASLTRARTALTHSRGAGHPDEIQLVQHLAVATQLDGHPDQARPLWDEALAVAEHLYGRDSVPVMRVLIDRANAETPGGATSTLEGLAAIERAVAIGEHALPASDPQRAQPYETLAIVRSALHHDDDAIAAYRRAVAFYDTLDDPMGQARVLYNYGDTLKEHGKCDDAVPQFRRAASVAQKTGQRTRLEGAALGAEGTCVARAGKLREAEAMLRQSIAVLDETGDVLFAAQNRWELAALLVRKGDRAGGIALARTAAGLLADRPPPADQLRAQILDWAAHPTDDL